MSVVAQLLNGPCPPATKGITPNASEVHKWCLAALQEGQAWLSQQPGWDMIELHYRQVVERYPDLWSNATSLYTALGDVKTGLFPSSRIQIEEVVAILANMRPLWNITNSNPAYTKSGDIIQKSTRAWWGRESADLIVEEALKWSAVCRTGYIWTRWDPSRMGDGDIRATALGPHQVVPLWLEQDQDVQSAYGVTVLENIPVVKARSIWPNADPKFFMPQRSGGWINLGMTFIKSALQQVSGFAGARQTTGAAATQNNDCALYHTYLTDFTYN